MGGFGPFFFYIHMEDTRDCMIKKPIGNDNYDMRDCLGGCGKKFWSQSEGNRRCKRCKQRTEDSDGLPQMWQECPPVPDTVTRKTGGSFIKSFGSIRPGKRDRKYSK
jgi:hypothetical protein